MSKGLLIRLISPCNCPGFCPGSWRGFQSPRGSGAAPGTQTEDTCQASSGTHRQDISSSNRDSYVTVQRINQTSWISSSLVDRKCFVFNFGFASALITCSIFSHAHTHTHLLWFNDVIAPYSVVSVAAAVIPSTPLTAPFTGHTGDTPANTTKHVYTHAVYLSPCVCVWDTILRCVLVLPDCSSTVVELILSSRHLDFVVHQNLDWDGHVVWKRRKKWWNEGVEKRS